MTNRLLPTIRDEALLRLLERTPVTTALILKAGETFPGETFRDDRRVRERLQTLAAAGYVRAFPETERWLGPWLNYNPA